MKKIAPSLQDAEARGLRRANQSAGLKAHAPGTLLALSCLLLNGVAAQALDIQLIDVSSPPMSSAQLAAFEAAAAQWESRFSDPITVKINVGFQDLDNGILGQTATARTTHNYTAVRAALVANGETGAEDAAMGDLPPGSTVPIIDLDGPRNDNKVTMATANAKALGLGTGLDPVYGAALPNNADASVVFATAYVNQFDFNRADGIGATKYDFESVAAHELGHALGFISLTDVQDGNPSFTLHLSTLDLWRFTETGGVWNLPTSPRYVTAGIADYYDSTPTQPTILPFSWGVGASDPQCCTGSGKCQASHWRSTLSEALMEPCLGPGESKDVHTHDRRAFDFIGYEDAFNYQIFRKHFYLMSYCKWWWVCPGCPPPGIDRGYPRPPEQPPLKDLPFAPNIGMVIEMDLGTPGSPEQVKRSAAGYALFRDARANTQPVLRPLPSFKGEQNIFPAMTRPEMLPAALMDLYFISDSENGEPFTARAVLAQDGAQFDPSIGEFGGYRVTLALDGAGDGVEGDVDGLMTVELLADRKGIPDGDAMNTFELNPKTADNGIVVVDALALGFCQAGAPKPESEPNHTAATANNLGAVGFVSVSGSIKGVGDVDYYRFTAPSNSKAWITVDTGGTQYAGANSRDSMVTLYAADGVTVIEEDNDDGSGNGANSTLESGLASAVAGRTLLAGGAYYVRVKAAQANQIISPYRLYLTLTTGPIPSEIESNNSAPVATSLVPPGSEVGVRSARLAPADDVDYYKVSVSGMSILHISADGDPERDGIATDVTVDLLDSSSTLLFSANSSAAGPLGNWVAEGYPYLVKSAGTYYVRVKGAPGVAGVAGTYQIMVAACRTQSPFLSVAHTRTGMLLSWPADLAGFRLQSSRDLRTWTDVGLAASPDGERLSVEVPATVPAQFYRLITD